VSNSEHILLQELREQPKAVRDTIDAERLKLDHAARLLGRKRIHFLGMGSSYFASLYANYLFAGLPHIQATSHIASEFIHYPSVIAPNEICIALSQSGESIETVNAARLLKTRRLFILGVTNQPKSALARVSDHVILTHAGVERASSTKTFASTLAILYYLVVSVAARSKAISERRKSSLIEGMMHVTRLMDSSLDAWSNIMRHSSTQLANCRASMVLARGPTVPAALQGALLMKEVAKIPAEGMTSGEYAHGPVEAASRRIGVVVLGGGRTSKLQYRLALRAQALHCRTLMVAPREARGLDSIGYGDVEENLAVFPCAVLLELLAYHIALKKRINPDRFRIIHKVTTQE